MTDKKVVPMNTQPGVEWTPEQMAAYPDVRLLCLGPISGPNTWYFRPYTHWHEIKPQAAKVLFNAGYRFA